MREKTRKLIEHYLKEPQQGCVEIKFYTADGIYIIDYRQDPPKLIEEEE